VTREQKKAPPHRRGGQFGTRNSDPLGLLSEIGNSAVNQRQVAVILVSVPTTQLSQPSGRISGFVGIETRASP
jgi:hypothetical protein